MAEVASSANTSTARDLLHRAAPVGVAPDAASEGLNGKRSKKAGKKGAATDEAGEKKGSKKKLIMILVVLLLVGYVAKGKFMKPHYRPGQTVPAGTVYELGTTAITTNLSDGHLIQVGISLQLTKAANSKLVTNDVPMLTNSTIKILSSQTYTVLLGPLGRSQLSAALLSAYQSDLGKSEGAQQVSAVYFTAFVLQ